MVQYPTKFGHIGPNIGLNPQKTWKFLLGGSYASCDEMTKKSPAKVGLTGILDWSFCSYFIWVLHMLVTMVFITNLDQLWSKYCSFPVFKNFVWFYSYFHKYCGLAIKLYNSGADWAQCLQSCALLIIADIVSISGHFSVHSPTFPSPEPLLAHCLQSWHILCKYIMVLYCKLSKSLLDFKDIHKITSFNRMKLKFKTMGILDIGLGRDKEGLELKQ